MVTYREAWTEAGRRLLRPYGFSDGGRLFADMYAELHASAVAFPDVPRALTALRERFPVANADRGVLDRCLRVNSLEVDAVVDSQSTRSYKPEPTIFLEACRRLGVEPAACVMVGDTPETDIRGARLVDMRAVWVHRSGAAWPEGQARPDAVITNLGELVTTLGNVS